MKKILKYTLFALILALCIYYFNEISSYLAVGAVLLLLLTIIGALFLYIAYTIDVKKERKKMLEWDEKIKKMNKDELSRIVKINLK